MSPSRTPIKSWRPSPAKRETPPIYTPQTMPLAPLTRSTRPTAGDPTPSTHYPYSMVAAPTNIHNCITPTPIHLATVHKNCNCPQANCSRRIEHAHGYFQYIPPLIHLTECAENQPTPTNLPPPPPDSISNCFGDGDVIVIGGEVLTCVEIKKGVRGSKWHFFKCINREGHLVHKIAVESKHYRRIAPKLFGKRIDISHIIPF